MRKRKPKPPERKTPEAGKSKARWIEELDKRKNLKNEATRLLGIVQGLKLLNAGDEELKKVEDDLWKQIGKTEDLQLAGLYAKLIAHLRKKDLDGAEEFLSSVIKR
ncbi:hypothetical protein [Thermococcus sp.]